MPSSRPFSPASIARASAWEDTARPRESENMDRHRILSEGLGVGLAGAAAVAVWFLVFDLIAGVPFRTPALLGAVLFHGLRDPSELAITARLVGAYTIVHCGLFVLFRNHRRAAGEVLTSAE